MPSCAGPTSVRRQRGSASPTRRGRSGSSPAWGTCGRAARRRRDRPLAAAIAFLGTEGLAVILGRGDCPFGGLQRQWGDPVPLFELVLPPRAAKAAVPVLAAVSIAGLAAVALRPPRR